MKKLALTCLVLAALFVVVACGGKKAAAAADQGAAVETVQPAPAETVTDGPNIDLSKTVDIDAQLVKYDEIIAQYLADIGENKADAIAADEAALAVVSEGLAALAVDFSPEQLAKYNEITAKMEN